MIDIKQGPKHVRIGIVAESLTDIEVYQNICKKLSYTLAKVIFPPLCSYNTDKDGEDWKGGVKTKYLPAIKKFYDKPDCAKLDIIIVFTDHDSGNGENINELREKADSLGFKQKILFVEPVENLESWLLQDQSTSNDIFGKKEKIFSQTDFVKAKDIFNDYAGRVKVDEVEARRNFAKVISVDKIKLGNFLEFKSDFTRIIREVISPNKPLNKKIFQNSRPKNKNKSITKSQANKIINLLKNLNDKIDRLLNNKKGGGN